MFATDDQLEAYENFYEEMAAQPQLGSELTPEQLGYDDEKPCLTEDQVQALAEDLTESSNPDIDPELRPAEQE